DGFAQLPVEPAEIHVHLGGGQLDDAERPHERDGHLFRADAEIGQRALRLGSPIAVRRHLDRAKGIGFYAGIRHGLTPFPWLAAGLYCPERLFFAMACKIIATPGSYAVWPLRFWFDKLAMRQ